MGTITMVMKTRISTSITRRARTPSPLPPRTPTTNEEERFVMLLPEHLLRRLGGSPSFYDLQFLEVLLFLLSLCEVVLELGQMEKTDKFRCLLVRHEIWTTRATGVNELSRIAQT